MACLGCGYDRGVITGVHAIVFSPEAEKVRAFFAGALGMPPADAGGGWLIFALPPVELAAHPADGQSRRELYLMCDDIQATLTCLTTTSAESGEARSRPLSDATGTYPDVTTYASVHVIRVAPERRNG